jgi:hypothetical protein
MMMRLTGNQREAISRRGREDFFERLARHIRRVFPDATGTVGDAELRARIEAVADRCATLGFVTELEIASMVEYILVFRLDLDGEYAQIIIRSEQLSQKTKLKRLGDVALHEWAASGCASS